MRDFLTVGLGILLTPFTLLLALGAAAFIVLAKTVIFVCAVAVALLTIPAAAFKTAFASAHVLTGGEDAGAS